MKYKVLGHDFDPTRKAKREVLGRFDFGGDERVKDDRDKTFLQAGMQAANVTVARHIYAIIEDADA